MLKVVVALAFLSLGIYSWWYAYDSPKRAKRRNPQDIVAIIWDAFGGAIGARIVAAVALLAAAAIYFL